MLYAAQKKKKSMTMCRVPAAASFQKPSFQHAGLKKLDFPENAYIKTNMYICMCKHAHGKQQCAFNTQYLVFVLKHCFSLFFLCFFPKMKKKIITTRR